MSENTSNRPEHAGIEHQLAHLQQSVDRLLEEVKQVREQLGGLERQQIPKSLYRDIRDIKERVFKEAISGSRERQTLSAGLEALQNRMDQLPLQDHHPDRKHLPEDQQRVGIFVDVQNIFYAAKQFNARLDFEKLLKVSVGNRRLIRAIAYVVQSPEVDQSGFISMLQQKSYEVRRKDLRQRSDGSAKGDWDMGMAIDIMGLVDKLDVVVLVSGDGDFVSLLNLVKTIGPRVEVISFVHNTARDLIQTADHHLPIEEALLMRPTATNGDKTEPASSSP
ncbi:MAG: NYN domain-containing protein [bacterium]|nr:NYN domain-containing protein [bacterium]